MKLVTRDSNPLYLQELKQLLENNGIPAFISGENTNRVLPSFLMADAGLWVYLDEQYFDAEQLVLNADHKVTTAIDVTEFYRAQPDPEEMQSVLNDSLIKLALYFSALAAGIILLTKLF